MVKACLHVAVHKLNVIKTIYIARTISFQLKCCLMYFISTFRPTWHTGFDYGFFLLFGLKVGLMADDRSTRNGCLFILSTWSHLWYVLQIYRDSLLFVIDKPFHSDYLLLTSHIPTNHIMLIATVLIYYPERKLII
jgi:hypothetical protein